MSNNQKVPLAIGAFIMGAFLLVFVALLFFSGGRLFVEKTPVVMYFEGSVQGLQVGAPVKLKGVVIGEISDIHINFPSDNSQGVTAAVIAELVLKRINLKGNRVGTAFFTRAIDNGLRAQLNYQSLLTGLLYVELDFYPGSRLKLYGEQDELLELPTIATDFEALSKDFQSMNLKGLVSNLDRLASQLSDIAASGQIQQGLASFDSAARAVEATASHLDVTQEAFGRDSRVVMTNLTRLLEKLDRDEPRLAESLDSSLAELRTTLASVKQAVTQVADALGQDSPLVIRLNSTLEDVSRSARSLRNLSETLDEQPEAILRGKQIIPQGE